MSTQAATRSLFRERDGAVPNLAVLSWCVLGWSGSFALMGSSAVLWNIGGVLLCTHTMVMSAYLIHDAAHQSLFATPRGNARVGEILSFIAGSCYGSFERIRHIHMRHHRDRVDLTCFDLKALLRRRALLRRSIELAEWFYLPAAEVLMHLQVIVRPILRSSHRKYLPRVVMMLLLRGAALVMLGLWSLKALGLYLLSYGLMLHVLNFFDAFHHTFEQHVVEPSQPVPGQRPDRAYENANTYSNLLSARWQWLNVLILNFCYHNAHHERASAPWHRLPAVHRSLYGATHHSVFPLRELLYTWHRNRVRRVYCEDYGRPGAGADRAASFIGAHNVSFLTVI